MVNYRLDFPDLLHAIVSFYLKNLALTYGVFRVSIEWLKLDAMRAEMAEKERIALSAKQ